MSKRPVAAPTRRDSAAFRNSSHSAVLSSQRRAASVKDFLVSTYHVDGGRLAVIGFGEEQLKNKDDPFADENRRVQIVNTGSATVAEGKPAEAAPEPEAAPEQEGPPPGDAPPPE